MTGRTQRVPCRILEGRRQAVRLIVDIVRKTSYCEDVVKLKELVKMRLVKRKIEDL
jgi:hypothetical protein